MLMREVKPGDKISTSGLWMIAVNPSTITERLSGRENCLPAVDWKNGNLYWIDPDQAVWPVNRDLEQ